MKHKKTPVSTVIGTTTETMMISLVRTCRPRTEFSVGVIDGRAVVEGNVVVEGNAVAEGNRLAGHGSLNNERATDVGTAVLHFSYPIWVLREEYALSREALKFAVSFIGWS